MSTSTIPLSLLLVLAFIVAVPLMFAVRILYTYFIGSFLRNRRNPRGTPEPTDRYFATYRFEFNGKEYKRRFKYLSEPPFMLTMYSVRKPSKAEPESSFVGMETGLLPFYVCSVVIAFVAMVCFFGTT